MNDFNQQNKSEGLEKEKSSQEKVYPPREMYQDIPEERIDTDKPKNSKERLPGKKRGWKFWVVFWSIAATLLIALVMGLEYKKAGWAGVARLFSPIVRLIPIEKQQKDEIQSIFQIAAMIAEKEGIQTFLVLFQNNLELRPGGGFIGAFGIIKIENGRVIEVDVHDTNIFDERISTGIQPPYPMQETLKIKNWEMRDSNWSPDFPTNAKKATDLYKLQGGEEIFDGVIAISTELLNTFIASTGPIQIEGFPGEYTSENAITKLEYQVERGYKEQGIEKGKRKYIMKDLAKEILTKAQNLSLGDKKDLLLNIEDHLNRKDVMFNFFDPAIQEKIVKINWDGEVEIDYKKDYLMMVDANLGAYKTDRKMKRSFRYQVDFTQSQPLAKLQITYTNTAEERDWMTSDYQSYLRVYTPEETWLANSDSSFPVKFETEYNKQYFGTLVQIPIGETRTFTFEYRLPENFSSKDYNLMIQKQSGVPEIQGQIEILDENGNLEKRDVTITRDWMLR